MIDKIHKTKVINILNGIAMGAANKVPGVSGGIVALVLGFYETFLSSLQKFNLSSLNILRNAGLGSFYRHVNGPFLIYIIFGMLVSYFSVSKILDYFLVHHELYVWSLFFGMIIGSALYIKKDFSCWSKPLLVCVLVGIFVGLGISFLKPAVQNENLWFVFFCGIVSVSGMTIPGFSGSFLLILLGNYVLLLVDSVNALSNTIVDLVNMDLSFLKDSFRIKMLKILAVFTFGSVVGLISWSHLLSYVIKQNKKLTMGVILGFIIGSLGVTWPWKTINYKKYDNGSYIVDSEGQKIIHNFERYIPELNSETVAAVTFIAVGIFIVLILDWIGKNRTK